MTEDNDMEEVEEEGVINGVRGGDSGMVEEEEEEGIKPMSMRPLPGICNDFQ